MNRDYADGITANDIQFFVGLEVEHTAAYGMNTLFVTGVHHPSIVLATAEEQGVKHIYFGANQSCNPQTAEDWHDWEQMIQSLLE